MQPCSKVKEAYIMLLVDGYWLIYIRQSAAYRWVRISDTWIEKRNFTPSPNSAEHCHRKLQSCWLGLYKSSKEFKV